MIQAICYKLHDYETQGVFDVLNEGLKREIFPSILFFLYYLLYFHHLPVKCLNQ